ncbi:MAG: rfbD [Ferruginibacter sp.]|nr:rfbD [Ferruginibacter sp.]
MAERKTILVTGANGQLGNEMQVVSSAYPLYDFLFVTREQLPIEDDEIIAAYFNRHTIDYCVNCAAYTAVDKAETEPEKAYLVNSTAVENLAKVCKAHNTQLIHISTDYVFDGTSVVPYSENDPVSPVNLYGASKLAGEISAFQNNPRSIIIRTSWVYSSFGNNFVKTMLRLMKERDSINVVSDQQGSPTYAADLAAAIMQIITRLEQSPQLLNNSLSAPAIFNYSNKGVTTWHGFATTIKELSGSKCIVNPITAAQYPTPAKRPGYSVMDTAKIQQTFDLKISGWKESLEICLVKMLQA